MTPERWQRIKEIFDGALSCAPEDVPAYLDHECLGDDALRQEVESLLSSSQKSKDNIGPVVEAAARQLIHKSRQFEIGELLNQYEIVGFLGKGGMGEVYEAFDKKLKRRVALKVLPALYAGNRERLQRFKREARAASGLNHPNIVTLYEIFEVGSTHVIVEELVGGDLRQLLNRRPLVLLQALKIAEQIAQALVVAHSAKIVHRDIKPENIGVQPDGHVKLLDYGLVKLIDPRPTPESPEGSTIVQTSTGIVLGTAHYMSPEQARGDAVDGRTDIFSLGTVIYEMLAGRRPFEGKNPAMIGAAILGTEPTPLSRLALECPEELERIVNKALKKDPDQRYQGVRDLHVDLRDLRRKIEFKPTQTPVVTEATTQPIRTIFQRHWLKLAVLLAFVVCGIGVVIGKWLRFNPPLVQITNPKLVRSKRIIASTMDQPTSSTSAKNSTTSGPQVLDTQPEISQDGSLVVYSSNHSGKFEIYKKQLGPGGVETRLTWDGDNFQPTLSPNGQWVAYYSKKDNGIVQISINSTEHNNDRKQLTNFGSAPKYSKDSDKIVFQSVGDPDLNSLSAHASSIIVVCTLNKGLCTKPTNPQTHTQDNVTNITDPDSPKGAHLNPVWSPDNQRIAFVSFTYTGQQIWSTSASGGQALVQFTPQAKKKQTGGLKEKQGEGWANPFARVLYPVYSKDPGRYGLYFVSGTTVWWQALLAANQEEIGEPERITETTGFLIRGLSVSTNGTKTMMVYGVQSLTSNLWDVKLTDSFKSASDPTWLTNESNIRNGHPAFSPDGSKLAFMHGLQGWESYISTMNANGTKVETKSATGSTVSWSPDGFKVIYVYDGIVRYFDRKNNQPGGAILPEISDVEYARISHNGNLIAYTRIGDAGKKIWVYEIDKKWNYVVANGNRLGFPVWAPGDKSIVYQQTENNQTKLMLTRNSDKGDSINGEPAKILPNNQGRNWPHSFSPDGNKIAFVSDRDGAWNVYWYSLRTEKVEPLTTYKNLNSYVRYPTWLPVGKANRIVYEYAEITGSIWLAELR